MIDSQSPVIELLQDHVEGFSTLRAMRDQDGALRRVSCTWANAAACKLLGKGLESVIECDLLNELSPTGELHLRSEQVLRTGEAWIGDSILVKQRMLRPRITRFRDELGLWLSDATVTEQLHGETRELKRRLSQVEAESQELRALFHTVFESSPMGIAVLDRSHRYVAVNDALVALLGNSATDLIGRRPWDLWTEAAQRVESVLDEVLRTGKPRLDNEVQITTRSGVRHLLFGSYPVRHGDQVLGTGSFVVDITERKQIEEYQRQLIGIVSHDLRSPLQAILIGAQLLLRSGRLDGSQQTSSQRILRCARRMSRLVEDLTDFTRIRVGQPLGVTRRPANVDEVCRQVLSEAEGAFPDRRLQYHGAGDPCGHWDAGRLVQVLMNLVTNAFKYTTPDVNVELAWWREPPRDANELDDDLILEVRNGGPPMPEDLLERLFAPFSRGKANDGLARSSLGLGLFIVKRLVEAHEGLVAVSSNDETGTAFRVRLPSGAPHDTTLSRWRSNIVAAAPMR